MSKVMFSILLFLLMIGDVSAYTFRHYKVENGLSQNTVWCIMQDDKGFMWFGTKDGLNRFDGRNFKIYTHNIDDTASIGNNFIRSLYQDEVDQQIYVGTDKSLYIFHPETETFTLFDIVSEQGTRIEAAVNSIVSDGQGNIWLGVFGQGVFRYHKASGKLTHFRSSPEENSLSSDLVWTICIDQDDVVWIGTLTGGLNKYNTHTGDFVVYRNSGTIYGPNSDDIYCIYNDSRNNLWIGTWNGGLSRLNRATHEFTHFFGCDEILSDTHIRSIQEFDEEHLLIGSEKGLFLFNVLSGRLSDISGNNTQSDLSDRAIYAVCKDKENGFWIGTYFGGINYLHHNNQIFTHWSNIPCVNSIQGKAISQICEDSQGNLWIGTEDEGLNKYIKSQRHFVHYHPHEGDHYITHNNIHALLYSKGKLWIGTFTKGLDVLDIATNRVRNYVHDSSDEYSLSDNSIYSIYQDKDEKIYVGTIRGLNVYNAKEDNFVRIHDIGRNTYVYDIIQDAYDFLWFATYGDGVFKYNPRTDEWKHYKNNPNDTTSLCHDKVISLLCDSQKRMWFGTEGGGFCEYDYERDRFKCRWNKKTGLPNDVIHAMVEDNNGDMWLSTNNSLVRYTPQNESVRTFTHEDGLLSNQFNYKSGFKSRDGLLYFGGVNGLNIFQPDNIRDNEFVPPVVFSNLFINNEKVAIADVGSPLQKSVIYSDEIKLDYSQSHISLDFVALSYCSPQKNLYAYKLEPLDKDWIFTERRNSIFFNSIPPGEYTLHVKASNNDNLWNEIGTSMKFVIMPPFWQTTFAKIIYAFVLVGGIVYLVLFLIRLSNKKHEKKLSDYKVKKEKEIYDSKIAFFTNIAHEIRTPLSLIKAPLESIIKADDSSEETKENLRIMQMNTERLHSLINQLLDFRKIGEGKMQLHKALVNMNGLIEKTSLRFTPKCTAENILLQIELPNPPIYGMVDEESMTKVLSNLLTNAMKYTKDIINIRLDSSVCNDEGFLEIEVADNGCGISEEFYRKIFDPFYQVENTSNNYFVKKDGTGIGLAYVKSIIEMHGGAIEVESELNKGTVFKIHIPHEHDSENEVRYLKQDAMELDKKAGQASILIVEDNIDLLGYLQRTLSKKYHVFTAGNGREGLQVLREYPVDLVVSDLIMPEMDGLELCKEVKASIELCHIPILMLTAKTDLPTKVESLEAGADVYIEKPFSIDFLLAQLASMFENREKLRRSFISSPHLLISSIANNKSDEDFLDKLNVLIEENLSNTDFSIETMAVSLGMSRSTIHRKIKGLSGLSPNDLIRLVRLKKAAELLSDGKYRVNEICYIVGFNSPSYFSKCFQQQFGVQPRNFGKNSEDINDNIF